MRPLMLALVFALSAFSTPSHAGVSGEPTPREVHDGALEEVRRLNALLEKMRRDCPDAGVDRKCTSDAGPEDNEQ